MTTHLKENLAFRLLLKQQEFKRYLFGYRIRFPRELLENDKTAIGCTEYDWCKLNENAAIKRPGKYGFLFGRKIQNRLSKEHHTN